MGRRSAKALHLGLFLLGTVLYLLFVLPRWWVLTGDIPGALATAGRLAAGIPLAVAALPVLTILRQALGRKAKTPELALRLRAWSAVLHVVAGALILLAGIAEIWLGLGAAGPYLFAVYGAAAALALLGALGLYLSFVAEKPPAGPKLPKPPKAAKVKKPKTVANDAKKPSTKRTRKADTVVGETVVGETVVTETVTDTEVVATESESDATAAVTTVGDATAAVTTVGDATAAVTTVGDATAVVNTVADADDSGANSTLRNKRPAGKSRLRRR